MNAGIMEVHHLAVKMSALSRTPPSHRKMMKSPDIPFEHCMKTSGISITSFDVLVVLRVAQKLKFEKVEIEFEQPERPESERHL